VDEDDGSTQFTSGVIILHSLFFW